MSAENPPRRISEFRQQIFCLILPCGQWEVAPEWHICARILGWIPLDSASFFSQIRQNVPEFRQKTVHTPCTSFIRANPNRFTQLSAYTKTCPRIPPQC